MHWHVFRPSHRVSANDAGCVGGLRGEVGVVRQAAYFLYAAATITDADTNANTAAVVAAAP
jgi:hypothetical protein